MIEFNNLTEESIDITFLKRVSDIVLKGEEAEDQSFSVAFVGEERIRELNREYRKIDKATDVLSFGEDIKEIVICPEFVKKQAKEYNKELAVVLIHGILHVLGYDHEKGDEMEKKQQYYLNKI